MTEKAPLVLQTMKDEFGEERARNILLRLAPDAVPRCGIECQDWDGYCDAEDCLGEK